MKLIPYDNFAIDTTLDAAEVERLIAANTEAPKRWYLNMAEPDFFFKGWVKNGAFELERNTNYRKNSFAPRISGLIKNTNEGSSIKIKLLPKTGTILFAVFLPTAFIVATIFALAEIKSAGFGLSTLQLYLPFLFGYGLMMLSFNFERAWASKFIIKLMRQQETILAVED